MIKDSFYISPKQTLFLKGIAILCILLHNFFHLIAPLRCQNEMTFDKNCAIEFVKEFSIPETINLFFSFFGFYGVYIFIFLSGYGLTKSFIYKIPGGGISFTFKHIIKVYSLLLISVALFILLEFPNIPYKKILSVLSLTTNFSPVTLFTVCGPWWFFSLIIQLYLLFVFLFRFIYKDKTNIFILWLIYAIIACYWTRYNGATIDLYANAIGHIPEFSLGIFIALYEKELRFLCSKRFNIGICLIAFIFIVLAQVNHYFFIFSFTASVIFALSLLELMNIKQNFFLEFSGKISPYLFGFNGFLFRSYFINLTDDTALSKIFWCFVWLIVNYTFATAFYFMLRKLYR